MNLINILILVVLAFLAYFVAKLYWQQQKQALSTERVKIDSPLWIECQELTLFLHTLYKDIINSPVPEESTNKLQGMILWDAEDPQDFMESVDDVLRMGMEMYYVRIFDKEKLDRLKFYADSRGFEVSYIDAKGHGDSFWEITTSPSDLEKRI